MAPKAKPSGTGRPRGRPRKTPVDVLAPKSTPVKKKITKKPSKNVLPSRSAELKESPDDDASSGSEPDKPKSSASKGRFVYIVTVTEASMYNGTDDSQIAASTSIKKANAHAKAYAKQRFPDYFTFDPEDFEAVQETMDRDGLICLEAEDQEGDSWTVIVKRLKLI